MSINGINYTCGKLDDNDERTQKMIDIMYSNTSPTKSVTESNPVTIPESKVQLLFSPLGKSYLYFHQKQ